MPTKHAIIAMLLGLLIRKKIDEKVRIHLKYCDILRRKAGTDFGCIWVLFLDSWHGYVLNARCNSKHGHTSNDVSKD